MYENGRGVAKDDGEAAVWYRKAADQKFAVAQNNLGAFYDNGRGVAQDYGEAVKWFRLAAEQGDATAQANLGAMYVAGRGVTQDYHEAFKWYRLAALQGHPAAQSGLGVLYAEGQGVLQDFRRGYMWFNLAASSTTTRNSKAAENRELVAKRLSPAQVIEAQAMAQTCVQSKFQNCGLGALPAVGGNEKAPGASLQLQKATSGTGFFVSGEGHIVTNAHVVEGCRDVRASRGGELTKIAVDTASDLALYLAKEKPSVFAHLRSGRGARVGEAVVAIGFPMSGLLSSDPIVTTGSISALSGVNNDRRMIQISAPIQPGNSGGPLLGENGSVVGVVVAKLNALKIVQSTGDIPQNVNFAVSLGTVQSFLNAYGVSYSLDPSDTAKMPTDISAEAANYTVFIECLK
jgi:S1-C subfamily serine protease